MDAARPGGADPLGRPPAVQPDAVEEALRRVVGRGRDVEPAALFVDGVDPDDIVSPRRQQPDRAAVAVHGVGVVPAVALAEPQQPTAAFEPDEVVHDLDPGLVRIGEDRPDLARGGVPDEDAERVLQAVEMLEDDLAGIPRPFQPGDVGLGRIARGLHPDGIPAGDGHDAGLDGGIGLAGLGVLEGRRHRIEAVGVVDHGEDGDARRVEPPKGDGRAVRAPAEAVADAELLLVDPIGGPVDDVGAPVMGQPGDPPRGQVLGVDVVLDDVGRLAAVGRELGEHQGRGLEVPPEPPEPARREVVGPEVAPGVLPPDPFRVGEDDQDSAVGRPGVILDRERLGRARRYELVRGDEDAALPRSGRVEDEVAGALGRFARLERRIGLPVAHPPGRAEALGRELPAGEDALDGQVGVGLGGRRSVLGQDERDGERGDEGEQDEGP